MRCPASFSYVGSSFAPVLAARFDFVPHALDAGQFWIIFYDLSPADIRDPEPAFYLPDPPGTFLSPSDLFGCGHFHIYGSYLRPFVKSLVEHDEKDHHGQYLKYIKYLIHITTPLEHDNQKQGKSKAYEIYKTSVMYHHVRCSPVIVSGDKVF